MDVRDILSRIYMRMTHLCYDKAISGCVFMFLHKQHSA
jgi:hypothetical protein